MPIRQRTWPYPRNIKDIGDVNSYLKKLYISMADESSERLRDFENMNIGSITTGDIIAKSPWVDVRAYASFSLAIDAIGSTEAVLLISEQEAVTANKTVPANVTLKFLQGGSLNITAAKTVTINQQLEAGLYQIFEGAGSVVGNKNIIALPHWFGAFDDNTNSLATSTAFRKAVAFLPSGGIIRVPEGIYAINGSSYDYQIELTSNLNIQMSKGAELRMSSDSIIANHRIFFMNNKSNIIIEGGTLTGYNTTGEQGYGIRIEGSENVKIRDVNVGGFTGDGIALTHRNATDTECEYTWIENCVIDGVKRNGITLAGCKHVYIKNNIIKNTAGNNPQAGIDIEPSGWNGSLANVSDVWIDGNYIHDNTLEGILGLINTVDQIHIINNTIEGNGSDGIQLYYLKDPAYSSIIGNTIKDNVGTGVFIRGTTTANRAISNMIVNNNMIIGNGEEGVLLLELRDSVISGNLIRDNGYCGIKLNLAQNYSWRNSISNNILIANSQDADNTYDNIQLTSYSDQNLIQGNICRDGGGANQPRYGINIAAANCDNNTVINNDLFDSGKTANLNDSGTGTIIDSGNRPFILVGSDTWDPGSIADGDEEAKEVTVTGVALGDIAQASFSLDVADLVLNAQVTGANTVTCVLANNTGAAIDLASGTIYVKVIKK